MNEMENGHVTYLKIFIVRCHKFIYKTTCNEYILWPLHKVMANHVVIYVARGIRTYLRILHRQGHACAFAKYFWQFFECRVASLHLFSYPMYVPL